MFSINIKGGIPIYEQLYNRITELISTSVLKEDEKLPTIREVAKELSVNPNTVQKTYQMLEQKGLIYSIPAKGSYVAKPDNAVNAIRYQVLDEFIESAHTALRLGITHETLHLELDKII